MDKAIFQLIQSFSPITDLVSDRVFPLIRDQESITPAITYKKISSPREYNDDGQISYKDQSFDLHLYAPTYGKLEKLWEAVENNLSGASGTFGGETIKYVEIMSSGGDDFLGDEKVYSVQVEIKITFLA